MMHSDSRRWRLVMPAAQCKALALALAFALALLVAQGIGVAFAIHSVAQSVPEQAASILQGLPGTLARTGLIAFTLIVPPVLAMVLGATHKVAGPVARMERFLRDHLAGKEVGRLELRKDDMLRDLAGLIDQVVEQQVAEGQRQVKPEARERHADRVAA